MTVVLALTQRSWFRLLAVATAAFTLLSVHYGSLLRDPDSSMFNGTGDGLKNYYVFAYHVQHDSTLMQFQGMNHPFGEQIGYPDAQPALSGLTQAAAKIYPPIGDHTVAVINLFCLVSMVLTALSIHLLLVHFRVGWIYAGICGIALAALSPQALRLQAGHHGLSYGWAIVLVILFLLRTLSADQPWKWSLIGVFAILLGLLLHPYTGMIALMWAGFILLLLIGPILKGRKWNTLLWAMVLLALPVLLFLAIQAFTDRHTGRAIYPLGFFEYGTSWNGLLSPPTAYRSDLSWLVFPWNMSQEFEASSYLGIGALLGVVVFVPLLALRWARNAPVVAPQQGWPWPITAMVVGSLPLIAFAFGLPFSEEHGPYPWSLPFIGQFRSPGRFAWAGYYALGIATMYGAWWWWHHRHGKKSLLGALFALAIPAIYIYEANSMHEVISSAIKTPRNALSQRGLTPDERQLLNLIEPGRYRAIIPIPFFLAGSDELLLLPDERALHLTLVLSQWSGLPMTSHQLSRPSVEETREQLSLLTPPWYHRPISARYAPTDEFLIIAAAAPANDAEAQYLELAKTVGVVGSVRLARITASELFKDRREELFVHLEELERSRTDTLPGGWISTQPDAHLAYDPLEGTPALHVYHGSGGHEGLKRDVNTLLTIPEHTLVQDQRYVASYWAYNRGHLRSHALTCVAQREPLSGKEEWIACGDIRFSRIVDGDWSLMEIPFTATHADHQYRIFAEGKKLYRDSIWCDEVMVRPADAETFRVLERDRGRITNVLYNGQFIKRP